jgi:hypothetical protein
MSRKRTSGNARPSSGNPQGRGNGGPLPLPEGVADRRVIPDRRKLPGAGDTGLERRRGPGRRLTDYTRDAEEGSMSREQFLFLMAIDAFKRVNHKTFPSWTDVLEIVRRLGYRKVQESELNLQQAEDWTEPPDAPLWPPTYEYDPGADSEGTRYDEAA